MLKGYIFDMDGTLIDSIPYLEKGDEIMFAKLGIPYSIAASDHMRYTTVGESAEWMNKEYNINITTDELVDIINQHLMELYEFVPVREGVIDFLTKTKKAGIKMCIATATPHDMAKTVCNRLGIMDYMDFLISCDEFGVTKSTPDVFLKCAEKMGLSPKEMAVFEDGVPGVCSSAKAGFFVVGVNEKTMNDFDRREIKNSCNYFIESFEGLEIV